MTAPNSGRYRKGYKQVDAPARQSQPSPQSPGESFEVASIRNDQHACMSRFLPVVQVGKHVPFNPRSGQ
jgi:hypothetical protein